jgi:hypothetical protein
MSARRTPAGQKYPEKGYRLRIELFNNTIFKASMDGFGLSQSQIE